MALPLALAIVFAIALGIALRPQFATGVILDQAGRALGLEITANGPAEYGILGTPRIVLRDVHARQPGAMRELLAVERLYLSVPWRTLTSRGATPDIERIELDAPKLDLSALAQWRKSQPPSTQTRLPTLERGLRVTGGEVIGEGWRLDGIGIDSAHLAPKQAFAARLRGRYSGNALRLPFDLQLKLSRPESPAAFGLAGRVEPQSGDWRLPTYLRLSAPLRWGDDGLHLAPARIGARLRYENGDEPIPFSIGLYGPVRISTEGLAWPRLALALRGNGPIPRLEGTGQLNLGERLALALDGHVAEWPRAWPAPPAPLSTSRSPLRFVLGYDGAPGLGEVIALRLQRDAAHFDSRLRLHEMLAWRDTAQTGSPLPPLDGRLSIPRLEIDGAVLEGVEVDIDDPGIAPLKPSK
ncbi:hypothetical protein EBB59_01580 [Lysobacter pythonis]|uniref:Dicarboxylate transport domain-containing protein n=1 Tax=Solilutibacter pythonis TaxID=2483112 RepID=A0A3M2HXG2_9GAMM|nr:hypothetical protein [Lysobacter pythonis]RMH94411.1 hypothetical protein EBB59_01580 [Lysobacter pythonis]